MEEKKTLSHDVVCFQVLDFGISKSNSEGLKTSFWGLKIELVENSFFLENNDGSEGVVYHNIVNHQQLPITRYQVRFCANNYFWVITNSVQCL